MGAARLLPAVLAALLAGPVPSAAQADDPQPGAGSRVGGRVATPYAELLAGVTVTLAAADGSMPARTAISSASGAFTFDNVPPGTYALSASKPGYTDREIVQARVRRGREITIADGQPAEDVELTMRRAGSIAGRIARPDGTPAPGAQVVVALRDGASISPLADLRAISEWDGRYDIAGVPPGEFLLMVTPPAAGASGPAPSLPVDVSPAPLQFEPTLYPGVPRSEAGGTVPVYEGVVTEGIDVWLMPAPQRFTVSGRVFWPEGVDVENIAIEYGGAPAVRSGVWYVDDPGGLFTLEGISQGTLVLLARADSSRGPLIGLAATEVLLGPVEEVRLELLPPGSVSGRIVAERPFPGGTSPRVSLTHTLLTVSALFPTEEAVAASDGRFHIPNARGAYAIGVHGLPPGWRVHRMRRNGAALPGDRLLVDTGDEITDLEIAVGP